MQLPGVHYNQDTNTAESRLFNWIIRDYGHGIIVQHASAPGGPPRVCLLGVWVVLIPSHYLR